MTLRVATFNTLHGRSPADGRVDLARFARAVGHLDADVLALQEVERAQPRSHRADLTALAARALDARTAHFAPAFVGWPGVWTGARRRSGRVLGRHRGPAYGIGLVSRHPARWVRRLDLVMPGRRLGLRRRGRFGLRLVSDEPRVALAALLETPTGPLTVVVTHLSPLAGRGAIQLERLVAACADLPRPLVLLGDLNLRAPHPARITGWEPLATVDTYPSAGPRFQLDHVLGDGHVRAVGDAVALDTGLSDHRAVVVKITKG